MTFGMLKRGALLLGIAAALPACGDEGGGSDTTSTTGFPSTTTSGDGGSSTGLTGGDASLTGGDGSATTGLTGLTSGLTGLTTGLTGGDAGASTTGDASATTGDASATTGDGSIGIPDAGQPDGAPIGPDGSSPPSVDPSLMGPYDTESTTEGLRDGPDYASQTLWYPTTGDGPFPIVAVVPGWVSVEAQIGDWGPFLASHGIITLTIGTNSPPTDLPPQRAAALLDALETLKAENTRSGGPVEGRVDASKSAVIGWSMGGGGALLAAEQDSSVDAVISLAGWNPNYAYSGVTQPALLFAGQSDALAGGQSQGFYSTIPNSVPKMFWESTNVTAFFGGHDTFNSPNTLDGEVGYYGLAWLKVYMEGNQNYMQYLTDGGPVSDHSAFCTNIQGADGAPGGSAAKACP